MKAEKLRIVSWKQCSTRDVIEHLDTVSRKNRDHMVIVGCKSGLPGGRRKQMKRARYPNLVIFVRIVSSRCE
jgi:hypothetical protein